MNQTTFLIYIIVVTLSSAVGCTITTYDDGDWEIYSERMIGQYYDADSMTFSLYDSNPVLRIDFEVGRWLDNVEVDNLTEKYNDKYWNRYISIYPQTLSRTSCYSNEFTGITVISDTDYNSIPAGQPLDPIVRIMATSPYRWLSSNGKLTYDWANAPADYSLVLKHNPKNIYVELFPVYKYIQDLVPSDMLLLNIHSLYLIFTETPAIKEHNLKITFKDPRKDVVAEGSVKFK